MKDKDLNLDPGVFQTFRFFFWIFSRPFRQRAGTSMDMKETVTLIVARAIETQHFYDVFDNIKPPLDGWSSTVILVIVIVNPRDLMDHISLQITLLISKFFWRISPPIAFIFKIVI